MSLMRKIRSLLKTNATENYSCTRPSFLPNEILPLLNLGCGARLHSAWTNVDMTSTRPGVIAHNLLSPLPFANESFDAVYHSHVLEHFPPQAAPPFLRECFRVLKSNGILRVVVPDLEFLARLYLENLDEVARGNEEAIARHQYCIINLIDQLARHKPGGVMLEYWKQNPMPAEDFVINLNGPEVLNALAQLRALPAQSISFEEELNPKSIGEFRLSGEPHLWMYDRVSLFRLLKNAGFKDIRVCMANESAIPQFVSYNLDTTPDGSIYKPESLFMEGIKRN